MSQSKANKFEDLSVEGRDLKGFAADERGNLTVFALSLFMMMTMIAGLSIDIMRYETMRTSLQNTLDRATLASASLSQQLDAEDVVTDYFAKAGLTQFLTSVEVEEGLNYRNVVADAKADANPAFLHLLGVDAMDAPGHSMAEQRMTNVEIVMVLDVSGSMASNSRLTNLKTAAREFVDTVLSSDEEDRISIAMVPFNGQVNLGANVLARYNETKVHNVPGMGCVDLPASVYGETSLSTATELPMTTPTDTFSSTDMGNYYVDRTNSSWALNNNANRWCPLLTGNPNNVVLPSQSISGLQAKISGLTAIGATSINAGMKWGMAFLDPDTRGVFTQLVNAGDIPNTFSGRPFEFTDPETMKIIVLMTDGDHFAEERLNDTYKTGPSPIFKSPYDGNYSIRFTTGRPGVAGNREYWVPHRSEWRATAWTNTTNTGAATLAPMNWETVWTEVRLQWVVWQLYARALGTNDSQRSNQFNIWLAEFRKPTAVNTMNAQLQSLCTQARAKGVTVYGIAFEAPSGGRAQISQCSTTPAHYFNAAGLQIRTAFRAIASNISQLRLTQ